MSLTQVPLGMMTSDAQYTGFKNRIINGGMVIDQRNAGASVTPNFGATYTVDRWALAAAQSGKFTIQQAPNGSVLTTPPAGFKNYLAATSTSAYSVLAADYFTLQQSIEGLNLTDLNWGTANAQPVTLSFWVRSSLTGTFGGAINNSTSSRSYPFTYVISSANTWEQKTITIPGDTSGTWLTTNGIGLTVNLSMGMGSTYTGTANAWAGTSYYSATGATSVVGTNGATFYITGVQLEKGTNATAFDYRPYGTELALCQRYYQKVDATSQMVGNTGYVQSATTANRLGYEFIVTMRSTPTVTLGGISVWDGSSVVGSLAFSSNFTNSQRMDGDYTVASGMATGRYCRLYNGVMQFNAEL